jgi:4-hydroxyphenylpyruvate dioxygenase-like putative hemolysin
MALADTVRDRMMDRYVATLASIAETNTAKAVAYLSAEFLTGPQLGNGLINLGIVIDHISQSMHYEEMLTWLLFYKSLLDLSKLPEQDLLDPGGLVKSQVLQSEDGALRLILNASQSARTQSSRFNGWRCNQRLR